MTKPFSTSSNGSAPRASHTRSSEIQPAPQRCIRSAAEKLRILQAYEAAPSGTSERGALLRREGIYSSQISKWRKLRDQGKLASPQRRGPKATPREMLADDLDVLRKENARLQTLSRLHLSSAAVSAAGSHLCSSSVVMMQATEHREGDDSPFAIGCRLLLGWDPLLNALMWSSLVEVDHVLLERVAQVPLPEDQHVIQAFAAHAANQAFAHRVRSGSLDRRSEHLDPAAHGDGGEVRPVLGIVVANEIFRRFPKRGSPTELLSDPCIGR